VYAVVRTGGKQYRVEEGRPIKIDRLTGEPGDTVELGEVLLMGEGGDVTVGVPFIAGARVVGTIAEQGRSKKIVVFKYKAKTRARKKTGHRQHFTRLMVSDILASGEEPKPKTERPSAAIAEAPEAAPAEASAPDVAAADAPVEKPKRSRKKADAEVSTETPAAEAPAAKPKRSRRKVEE
jgi:large subunit ribosomal protein L21